jgi:hypothetical protein
MVSSGRPRRQEPRRPAFVDCVSVSFPPAASWPKRCYAEGVHPSKRDARVLGLGPGAMSDFVMHGTVCVRQGWVDRRRKLRSVGKA